MTFPDTAVWTALGIAVPAIYGWVWSIQNKVTSHEQVIQKMDQLITILLQDRLSK